MSQADATTGSKFREIFNINRKLLPLKIVLLFLYGGTLSVMPFQPGLMRSIGLDLSDISFIMGTLPLTNIPGNAISSMIADKTGQYKPIICFAILGFAVSMNMFLAVPYVYTDKIVPTAQLTCGHDGSFLTITTCSEGLCSLSGDNSTLLHINSCDVMCDDDDDFNNSTGIPQFCLNAPDDSACTNQSDISIFSNNNVSLKLWGGAKPLGEKFSCNYPLRNFSLSSGVPYDAMTCPRLKDDCRMVCQADVFDSRLPTCEVKRGNKPLTFALCFFLAICTSVFSNICFVMFDACIFTMCKHYKSDFAKNRIWCVIGKGSFTPLAGLLIDIISTPDFRDFTLAFVLSDCLLLMAAIMTICMELKIDLPKDNLLGNLGKIMKRVEVVAFFFIVFCLGTIWGFVYNFLFMFLATLNSPNYLKGMTATVANWSGIPFLLFASLIIGKFGKINIIVFGCLAYSVRMMTYSFITNPWFALPIEGLGEICSLHVTYVAAATYANEVGGEGMRATMQALIRLTHFSFGRSSGSFLGGNISANFGFKTAFRVMALYVGSMGVCYWLLYHLYLKKIDKRRQEAQNRIEEADKLKAGEENSQPLTNMGSPTKSKS